MENGNYTIKLAGGLACNEAYRFKEPINLCIEQGQQVAIIGPNASGKSLLVNTLLRQYPLMDNRQVEYGCGLSGSDIRFIAFRDSYGSADSTYFYQQRWNMTEMGESPVVSEAFSGIADSTLRQRLFDLFELERIWDKQLVTLSSGEMRKYQLARTLAVSSPEYYYRQCAFQSKRHGRKLHILSNPCIRKIIVARHIHKSWTVRH